MRKWGLINFTGPGISTEKMKQIPVQGQNMALILFLLNLSTAFIYSWPSQCALLAFIHAIENILTCP